MTERAAIQEAEYEFPYHHIPHFDVAGVGARARILPWGLDYLLYLGRMRDLVVQQDPDSVLDVGCGDGRFLGLLPASIGRRMGVDLSERAIQFARAFHPGIEFDARDAADLEETFDVVTAVEVLEHVPDESVPGFLRALAARTRPGGAVVICVPSTFVPVTPKHFRHYDEELLTKQLADSGAPLRIEHIEWACRRSRLAVWYRKLTLNRLWFAEIWPVRKRVWNYLRKNTLAADKGRGKHVIAVCRREDGER